jgi:two-component system response regulator
MADDDEDDCLLAREALLESSATYEIHFVKDGVELLQYLRREGDYCSQVDAPRPSLILLDLNMPRKDGREALSELKFDEDLMQIPVVIFTTSHTPEDIERSTRFGAAFYQTKPVTFSGMVSFLEQLTSYCVAHDSHLLVRPV